MLMLTNMAATSQNRKKSIWKQTSRCTARRIVLRRTALIRCLSLISLYIRQHFIKVIIKKLCSFLYFYVNIFYLFLFLDIDILEGQI